MSPEEIVDKGIQTHSFIQHTFAGAFSAPVSGTQHSVENREIMMMNLTDCGSDGGLCVGIKQTKSV